jgi:hypothetical protein
MAVAVTSKKCPPAPKSRKLKGFWRFLSFFGIGQEDAKPCPGTTSPEKDAKPTPSLVDEDINFTPSLANSIGTEDSAKMGSCPDCDRWISKPEQEHPGASLILVSP